VAADDVRLGFGRIDADGTRDTTFRLVINGEFYNAVYTAALQPDGKVLIGGLVVVNGTNFNRIARLNANGSLDGSFNSGPGVSGAYVDSIALQPDGRILIGGYFTLARLNADGSLDSTFVPSSFHQDLGVFVYPDFGGHEDEDYFVVAPVVVQPDGKVIVGGVHHSTCFGGEEGCQRLFSTFVLRLNPNGSLDDNFISSVGRFELSAEETVQTVALQPDGTLNHENIL